jgi:hypothetical protein
MRQFLYVANGVHRMVNDYFSQAAIDFFLGNVSSLVFDEFEATMRTKDPGVSMSKMRELAIETSQKIAIEDEKEDFIGGWTLLSPHASDTIKSVPFEEVVLLLTDAALYLCRFDWNLDKVSSFERVELSHVTGIKIGTYITSTISSTQTDESKNVGMVVTYEPGKTDIKRTNTRSLSSISGQAGNGTSQSESSASAPATVVSGILSSIAKSGSSHSPPPAPQAPRKVALKAIYAQSAISDKWNNDDDDVGGDRAGRGRSGGGGGVGRGIGRGVLGSRLTEMQQIELIVAEIERLVLANQAPPPRDIDEASSTTTTVNTTGHETVEQGDKADTVNAGESGVNKNEAGKVEVGKKGGGLIERGDIISLEEARRATGLFEQLGHTIKKLVWA